MALRFTEEQFAEMQRRRRAENAPHDPPKRKKYGNREAYRDGWRFDSEREARCYDELKLRQASGEVAYFLRQVPLHLVPASSHKARATRMVVDFVVFHADGRVQYLDAKGYAIDGWKTKAAMAEQIYGIKIETW